MIGKDRTRAQWAASNEAAEKQNADDNKKKANDIVIKMDLPEGKRQACHDDALKAIWDLEEMSDVFNGTYVAITDATKRSLRRFSKAVGTLEKVWETTPLFPFEAPVDSMEEVLAFGRRCEELVKAKDKPRRKDAYMKGHAARQAHALLTTYDVPIRAGTKGSTFCRVATLLYGADEDLLSHCKKCIHDLRKKGESAS